MHTLVELLNNKELFDDDSGRLKGSSVASEPIRVLEMDVIPRAVQMHQLA